MLRQSFGRTITCGSHLVIQSFYRLIDTFKNVFRVMMKAMLIL